MNLGDVLTLMRPRQWSKNLAVFAGVIFSGKLLDLRLLGVVSVAFVAFCLIASALYAFNDVVDAQRDRQHPVKRNRPVASGRMSVSVALGLALSLGIVGLTLSILLGRAFLATVLFYGAIQLTYALWLKHVQIVDMLSISSGFVVRAVSGAVVISVPVSPWLVLCTGLLALFLAAAKRRHEIVLLGNHSGDHRPVLSEYTAQLLDSFMVTLSAATITTYALYTFFQSRGHDFVMMATIPFVIYGLLRYQYLVLGRDEGGRPEDTLVQDRPILVDVVMWFGSVVLALYVVPQFIR